MKKRILYIIWALFYLMCALLGKVESPTAAQSAALTALSLIFFIPPTILLVDALRKKNKKQLFILRFLSILSLTLTLALLIANIAVVGASETVGDILYMILNVVSVPMVCSQHYALSMFLWACLLFASIPGIYKKK